MWEVSRNQKPGDLLGKYEIIRFLGEGSMGVVWVAKHTITEAEIALKILPEHKDDAAAERFSREVTASTKVKHPGVVKVLDAGHLPDGRPFIAMELLDGESLDDRIQRDHQNREELLDVVCQILEPLGAAHAQGIVHRDLKPENIYITKNDEGLEKAKILDFGIARDVSSSKSATQIGIALGTPWYMSPEQATSPSKVGPESDIWSIGVMIYEIMCGEPPFDGESVQSVIISACTEPHVPIQQKCPDVSPELCQLVEKCLCKDPSDRPPNGSELDQLLSPLLSNPEVRASLNSKIRRSLSPSYPEIAFSESGSVDSLPNVPALDVESWKKQEAAELRRIKTATGITSVSGPKRWVWGGVIALGAGIAAGVFVFGMNKNEKSKSVLPASPEINAQKENRFDLDVTLAPPTGTQVNVGTTSTNEVDVKDDPTENEKVQVQEKRVQQIRKNEKKSDNKSSRVETKPKSLTKDISINDRTALQQFIAEESNEKTLANKNQEEKAAKEIQLAKKAIEKLEKNFVEEATENQEQKDNNSEQEEPKNTADTLSPPLNNEPAETTLKEEKMKKEQASSEANEKDKKEDLTADTKASKKERKKVRKRKVKKKTSNKPVPFVTF